MGNAETDAVRRWKQLALDQARRRRCERGRAAPATRVHVSVGFVLLWVCGVLLAASLEVRWLAMLLVLPSVLLVSEVPRALVVCAMGRSSEVRLSASGAHTEVSGPVLHGGRALAFAAVGALASGLVAAGAALLLHFELPARARDVLEVAATSHAVWGLAALLPLLPFQGGQAVARRLQPDGRLERRHLRSPGRIADS